MKVWGKIERFIYLEVLGSYEKKGVRKMVGLEPQIEKLSPGVLVMGKGRLWFVVVQGNYEYEFLNGKRRKLPFIKQILKADARR